MKRWLILVKKKKKAGCKKCGLFWWGILILALKTFGLAFLVQGVVLQLGTGVLYSGLIHYAIGLVFIMLGWHTRAIAKERHK